MVHYRVNTHTRSPHNMEHNQSCIRVIRGSVPRISYYVQRTDRLLRNPPRVCAFTGQTANSSAVSDSYSQVTGTKVRFKTCTPVR